MIILGYYYEQFKNKIHANGRPISRELINQGYTQKNNAEGIPRWYVKPNKVWILVQVDGERTKYNIYDNILYLYPERKRITLKLAHEVMCEILSGKIEFVLVNGKPHLIRKNVCKKKTKKN